MNRPNRGILSSLSLTLWLESSILFFVFGATLNQYTDTCIVSGSSVFVCLYAYFCMSFRTKLVIYTHAGDEEEVGLKIRTNNNNNSVCGCVCVS